MSRLKIESLLALGEKYSYPCQAKLTLGLSVVWREDLVYDYFHACLVINPQITC